MGSSLALSCNIRLFVIELDYGYRYLLEVCSELSDICFLIWVRYCLMLALHDRPVLAMINISTLELYQLLQYSYVCSSVMSVHPEGGGSARDIRISAWWMAPAPGTRRGAFTPEEKYLFPVPVVSYKYRKVPGHIKPSTLPNTEQTNKQNFAA